MTQSNWSSKPIVKSTAKTILSKLMLAVKGFTRFQVTFYLDSQRVWPLSQQPSHANLWRFHYGRSQVLVHTNARGPGDPATSPGGDQAKIPFPTQHRLTQLAAISPLYSLHVISCQPMSTQANPTSARWRQSYSPYNERCDWLITWVAEVNL